MTEQPSERKRYKMPKGFVKGVKRLRGEPVIHKEKKDKLNLSVTRTAKAIIENAAKHQGISMSELVERWAKEELVKSMPKSP